MVRRNWNLDPKLWSCAKSTVLSCCGCLVRMTTTDGNSLNRIRDGKHWILVIFFHLNCLSISNIKDTEKIVFCCPMEVASRLNTTIVYKKSWMGVVWSVYFELSMYISSLITSIKVKANLHFLALVIITGYFRDGLIKHTLKTKCSQTRTPEKYWCRH